MSQILDRKAYFSIERPRVRIVSIGGHADRRSLLETLLEQLPNDTCSKAASAPRNKDGALISTPTLAAKQATRPLLASGPLHAPIMP